MIPAPVAPVTLEETLPRVNCPKGSLCFRPNGPTSRSTLRSTTYVRRTYYEANKCSASNPSLRGYHPRNPPIAGFVPPSCARRHHRSAIPPSSFPIAAKPHTRTRVPDKPKIAPEDWPRSLRYRVDGSRLFRTNKWPPSHKRPRALRHFLPREIGSSPSPTNMPPRTPANYTGTPSHPVGSSSVNDRPDNE